MTSLTDLDTFGDIAAEDDAVLDYFLATEATAEIKQGKILLVLGRKGSGKTALVRHFTETMPEEHGRPLSLRNYPWTTHQGLVDKGASRTEAYVESWRLLVAIRLASMLSVLGKRVHLDSLEALKKFLMDNFGTLEPETRAILSQGKLRTTGLTLGPQIAGVALGSITFGREDGNKVLGLELHSLTNSILHDITNVIAALKIERLFLHFDELDQGLDILDNDRANMLIGLILAAREISNSRTLRANICPVVYLRTDIWEQLDFSDKNKITQSSTLILTWNEKNLLEMINSRLRARLGETTTWPKIEDGAKMRGSQSKWLHILSRTMLRPRDVIHFLNIALKVAKARSDENIVFTNEDINFARESYSKYLKEELHDEIVPHWKEWSQALNSCSRLQRITFKRDEFESTYNALRTKSNKLSAMEALEALFRFSVVGYERRLGRGGSSWLFRYSDGDAGWDPSAPRYKVHLGLKEFAKLKEERGG